MLVYLAIAAAMAILLSLYYIVKHKAFAFVDIGSDTFFQFLPLQIAEVRQLRALHELTWSFDIGLGAYMGSDFDPIQLLAVLFPDSWQLVIRLPLYLLKLLLAGAFFQAFLRRAGFEREFSVIGGLGYAFCSFAIVNGQWGENGFALVQYAALLCFLEGYLRDRSRWNAVAVGIAVGSGAAFDVYTLSLFSVLYLAASLPFLARHGWRPLVGKLASLAGLALLGFLLLAPIQFPNLYYLLDSPRVSGNHSVLDLLIGQIFQRNDSSAIGSELAGIFGKDLLGTADQYHGWGNYFEGPGFYVGILPLMCIPQLFGGHASRRERWYAACGVGLLIAYLIWPALRYAVYGFGHNSFRLSTLWASIGLLVLGLAGLRRMYRSGVWMPGVFISIAGIFVVLIALASFAGPTIKVRHLVLVVSFALAYAAVLPMLFRTGDAPRDRSLQLLLPIVALELFLFAVPPMMERNAVGLDGTSSVGRYDDGTTQALAWIRANTGDADFYRVEKTYNSVFLCDALIQDYSGVKSYFFHGSSLTRFVDRLQLQRPVASVSYIGSAVERPDVLSLLGVRYVLDRDRSMDHVQGMTWLGNTAGINIYRNGSAHEFGHIYPLVASESDADRLPLPERDRFLLDHATVDDAAAVRKVIDSFSATSTSTAATAWISIRKASDIALDGDYSTTHAGLMLLAMPYDRGWRAWLDGKQQPMLRADYGLTGFVAPPGFHHLALTYSAPFRGLGLGCMVIALALLMTWQISLHRAGNNALVLTTNRARQTTRCDAN
ncbi:MAG TPA: YfhO family protein [Burkholderiales bacterium]|nr:YfhO family protein [Burkholderiales bacterium]